MADDPPRRSGPRYLLTAVALSAGSLLSGCGSGQGEPLPGNPKGSVYDNGTQQEQPIEQGGEEPTGEQAEEPAEERAEEPAVEPEPEPEPEPEAEAEPETRPRPRPQPRIHPDPQPIPLPSNPKGSRYDRGFFGPSPVIGPSTDTDAVAGTGTGTGTGP